MTDEAHGYNSEDAPARPASTRWSEDAVQDEAVQEEDGLAPPYVPGRRTPTAASTSTTSTSTSASTSDDDFPFGQLEVDRDADTAGPEGAVGEEAPAADQPGAPDDFDSEADELVWSPEELDDGDEPFGRAEREYEEESYAEWTPGYEDEDDSSAVDAELEPIMDEPPVEEAGAAEVEAEHRFEPDGSIETEPAAERVEEVAAVLDRLAELLREQGEEAVHREMQSPDRLTALVSSLLSGHLSAGQ